MFSTHTNVALRFHPVYGMCCTRAAWLLAAFLLKKKERYWQRWLEPVTWIVRKVRLCWSVLVIFCNARSPIFLRCLMRDDRQRWSATQLLEHPFVKDPLPPSPKEGFSGGQGKRFVMTALHTHHRCSVPLKAVWEGTSVCVWCLERIVFSFTWKMSALITRVCMAI